MKKIFTFGLAIASIIALSSCQKDDLKTPENTGARISANYEAIVDAETKATISEGDKAFSLLWSGNETMWVGNSTTTNRAEFSMFSHEGKSAIFWSGYGKDFPKASYKEDDVTIEPEAVNYFGVVSTFGSSANGKMRGEISPNQNYNGTEIGAYAILAGKSEEVAPGTSVTMDLKTMNAFIKFPLVKGAPASGAKNTYTKMYVQSIEVAAVAEDEYIAGRFEISKTADDWYDKYAGVVSDNAFSKVTLNCVTEDYPDGIELGSTAIPFYVTAAFGDYAEGLEVTITVKNQDGKYGYVQQTIGSAKGCELSRNTMLRMPSLTVNPKDLSMDKYSVITDPSKIAEGTYFLAAKVGGTYQLWDGTINSGDCVTVAYTYNADTKVLSGDGAAEITLTKVSANCFKVSVGGKFLTSTAKQNRKLSLANSGEGWTFAAAPDTDDAKDRGMSMMYGGEYTVYMQSAVTAASKYIRSYTSFGDDKYGIFLIKKD